ncbi:MAG: hypothetical protein J6M12_09085 [Clostridia bacterium]|nr:hypothetical protein [Clostridia bacterium]
MEKREKAGVSITAVHCIKLVFRVALFLLAIVLYVVNYKEHAEDPFGGLEGSKWLLWFAGAVLFIEMLMRYFPSKHDSIGCQKFFKRNYLPTGKSEPVLPKKSRAVVAASAWFLLNGAIWTLYFTGVIDAGILVLVCIFYSVGDKICVLFFCPFQALFMKNKCCATCRIYNWDFPMMCTPLWLVPGIFSRVLAVMSLGILLVWELSLIRHPERFSENTNACLSCKNCKEPVCRGKRKTAKLLPFLSFKRSDK